MQSGWWVPLLPPWWYESSARDFLPARIPRRYQHSSHNKFFFFKFQKKTITFALWLNIFTSPSGVSDGHNIPIEKISKYRNKLRRIWAFSSKRDGVFTPLRRLKRTGPRYFACLLELRIDSSHHPKSRDVRQAAEHLCDALSFHSEAFDRPISLRKAISYEIRRANKEKFEYYSSNGIF